MRKFLTLILAIFLVLPVSAQVGRCELRRSVTDSIWTISQTHPDGFTVNVRTMTVPTEGICVAYSATQDSHGRDALEEVVSHATQHDGFVGGWMDPSDSLYYFDSVRVFPEDSLEAAINFGKAHFQKAVYRLSTSEEIILKEDPEWVSPTNLNRRGTGPHLSPYQPGDAPDGSPLIGSDRRTCSSISMHRTFCPQNGLFVIIKVPECPSGGNWPRLCNILSRSDKEPGRKAT